MEGMTPYMAEIGTDIAETLELSLDSLRDVLLMILTHGSFLQIFGQEYGVPFEHLQEGRM